jgi:hypothetical protein
LVIALSLQVQVCWLASVFQRGEHIEALLDPMPLTRVSGKAVQPAISKAMAKMAAHFMKVIQM